VTILQIQRRQTGRFFVTSVAAGAYHSLLATEDGDVYSAGSNRDGALGLGVVDAFSHPELARLPSTLVQGKTGIEVFAGAYSSVAVTVDNYVTVWGWNSDGQLGLGASAPSVVPNPTALELPPSPSGGRAGIVAVGQGLSHTVVSTEIGDVTGCGFDRMGFWVCGPAADNTLNA